MKRTIEEKCNNWQSIFILFFNNKKDKLSPELQIKLLLNRVISLERQNLKLKKSIKHKKDLNSIKSKEVDYRDVYYSINQNDIDFYKSKKWLNVRYFFLKQNDRICVLCGSNEDLHVDHIIPRSIDPSLELNTDNLQILCKKCNFGKSNKDTEKIILRRKMTMIS